MHLRFALACLLAGCSQSPTPAPSAPGARVVDPAGSAVPMAAVPWTLPAPVGSAQPDLVRAADGAVLLSWIEPEAQGHVLRFARHADGAWSAPRTVARGDDWFVNWADTPHLQATSDGALWAQWLQRSAAAPYAYDVVLSRSADAGVTWSPATRVNDDATPTEHGFVSLWPGSASTIGVAWLDGRRTSAAHGGHADHGGGGSMTLRSAMFDAELRRSGDTELDASTCDCCQTDVALTPRGAVLAYRDRTDDEIRDIAVTRLAPGGWSAPRIVHGDGWRVPGCPVNGPAMASRGAEVAVGWYTEASGGPRVRLALGRDGAMDFGPPREIAVGPGVLGRVAVAWTPVAGWIGWLEEDADVQSLHVARFAQDFRTESGRTVVARLSGRGRATGVPQMVASSAGLHVVWTHVVSGRPELRGAIVVVTPDRAGRSAAR